MASPDRIILSFSVKKPQKDFHYQIKVFNEDLSLGICGEFETEDKKCVQEQNELLFEKSIEYNFYFDKRQNIKFKIIKKIRERNKEKSNYKVKEAERQTTISSIITSPNGIYERPLNKKESTAKDIFCIKINRINNKNNKNNTIFDFLISGLKLSGFLALDFSNGKNKIPLTKSINKYKEIIIKILDNVSLYIKGHSFYVYGYGAKLKNCKNDPLYKSIFNINMTNNNETIKNEELIKTFNNCSLQNIIPDKEVGFSSLIRKLSKEMYLIYDLKYYDILFILAREIPNNSDKQETIDSFVESSYLPLTIIIICEGENEFNKMEELYGNKIKKSSNGMDKVRNNIKCINSKDFNDNSEDMIEWCLREISLQIIEYYKINKCTPEQIKLNTKNKVKESVDKYKNSIWQYESRISVFSQNEFQKKLDKKDDKDDNQIPNYSQIYEQSKNVSNQNKNEQKDDIDTPSQYIIPTTDSIRPDFLNPYNNNNNKNIHINQNNYNNQKYTLEGPINESNINILNNQIDQYNFHNQINPYKEKGYIITPGNSVLQVIEGNPYQKQIDQKVYKITPQESIISNINYNPYQNNKIETPHGQKSYIIPKQSIIQDKKNIINPYNNKNQVNQKVNPYNNINQINQNLNTYNKNQVNQNINPYNINVKNNNYISNNKIKNNSGQSEFTSTNNSNINQSIKNSNYIRTDNYSRD